MSIIIFLAALTGAFFSGWVTISHLVRMKFRRRGWALDWAALTLPLYAGLCFAYLTIAGIIGIIPGIALSLVLLGTVTVLLVDSWRKARLVPDGKATRRLLAALASQAQGGLAYIREDVSDIAGLFRREQEPDSPQPAATAAENRPRRGVPAPGEWPSDPRARGGIPPVREDPHLGDPGTPDYIAGNLASAGAAVSPAWAALADSIGSFEPDDEDDLFAAIAADAAGVLTVADAIRARADALLHGTGLDPAYIAGHADFADEFAGLAQAVALLDRRYHVIYGTLRDAVGNGMVLPHRAREFFGGAGTSPAAESGEDEAAA